MPKYNKNIHHEYLEYTVWLVKRNKQVDLLTLANKFGITVFYLKYYVLKLLPYHTVGSTCIEKVRDQKGVEYLVWICEEKPE